MSRVFAYTLVADGSSAAMLRPVLDWLICDASGGAATPSGSLFDPRRLRRSLTKLSDHVAAAAEDAAGSVLFVHRDAEQADLATRVEEIERAAAGVSGGVVPVVPVRMSEAWLLFDEQAIRTAAGNPAGRKRLALPAAKKWDALPDPKEALYGLIREASELSGRRLKKLNYGEARAEVARLIEDFSPLRSLPAFEELRTRVQQRLAAGGYAGA
ncbi:DUF4276 family protein [Phycisphaera mikurensis]|uniref:DUF4276 family protein n=1 Tax=Phycisphaera mikurensis (strain NBRC 102666 / KCTC 22515 / FYK2301M01) TaxID=1142394 RepID=I0IEY9_PHYMF|nr:DUF4276 family protein [Phycisphaera mikurensis]MBB6441621.1 hypothetical protein [Phycisphaera mikurensis]BAM03827.1 hypothetical protein PSMK_16680 [Phycisphaera mikurensis NBRC 102666]